MTEDVTAHDLVYHELQQCTEVGHDITEIRAQFDALVAEGASDEALMILLAELQALGVPSDLDANEPSDWDGIENLLPANPVESTDIADLDDRILAAWQGRIAGNMLGKPVEYGWVWNREHLTEYLERVGAMPLQDYIPVRVEDVEEEGFRENWIETTLGRVSGSSRDDDVDYTILGLHILETYGPDFTTDDVANEWLERFPFHQVYTAERAAYRNLVAGVPARDAGAVENPYREWIGALIRGDVFGYVWPGNPRAAAKGAYADAYLSHRANGIYGEMWASALVSAAFLGGTPEETIRESLRHIPPASRLATEIEHVLADYDSGMTWDETVERVEGRYQGMHWVHTINNAGVICAGLLWGGGDFTKTIALTVRGGMDTDSNGATAGSVVGILNGTGGIPSHWIEPLEDRVRSALFGFDGVSISNLAMRTMVLARKSLTHDDKEAK